MADDGTANRGVSADFWAGAVEVLVALHGNRYGTPDQLERLRAALAEAEAAYKKMSGYAPGPGGV